MKFKNQIGAAFAFIIALAGCTSDPSAVVAVSVDGGISQDIGGNFDSQVVANDAAAQDTNTVKPECVGMADCNDGNICTFDACEKGKCVHAELADKVACNDGDPCTTGICKLGTCHQNKTDGTNGVHGCVLCKSDADCPAQVGYAHYCTGDKQQDEKFLGCVAGVCNWGVGSFTCEAGCDSTTGMCKSECSTDSDCGVGGGLNCENSIKTETFNTGKCLSGKCEIKIAWTQCTYGCSQTGQCNTDLKLECSADSDCDDKIACTADICTSDHKCLHVVSDNLCNDGKLCVIADKWSVQPSGCYECESDKNCNDGNSCTDDICFAGKCEHPAVDSNFTPVGCDADADACTIDYCSDGVCKSKSVGQTKCPECQTDQDCSAYNTPQCSDDGKFMFWTEQGTCDIMTKEPLLGVCKFAVIKKKACPTTGCQWGFGQQAVKCE